MLSIQQVRTYLTIAVAVTLAGCRPKAQVPDGDVAAMLTAPSLGMRAFDPQSLKGKPALVMFVSPTCPHCIKEMPIAAAVAKDAGANAIAVFIAGRAANAEDAAHRFGGTALIDNGTLRDRFHITAVPYTLVLDGSGHATDAFIGEQDASTLAAALADAR
jgi:thiol-disulfide isomerase/thioredoxin